MIRLDQFRPEDVQGRLHYIKFDYDTVKERLKRARKKLERIDTIEVNDEADELRVSIEKLQAELNSIKTMMIEYLQSVVQNHVA